VIPFDSLMVQLTLGVDIDHWVKCRM